MSKARTGGGWVEPVMLGIITLGAFLLRTLPQLSTIFVNGQVLYREVDTWYQMRLVDIMMKNFPNILRWDMYAGYPNGGVVGWQPLLAWLVYLGGKLMDYQVWAAWISPTIGTLTLVAVYFIGRELWSGKVGLLAAGILAILPGEFLHRTMLGYPDQHFLEALLFTSTVLFLLLATRRSWKWCMGSGVSLGLYTLAWEGSAFLMLIMFVWCWYEYTRSNKTVLRVVTLTGLIGVVMYLPFSIHSTSLLQTALAYSALIVAPPTAEYLRNRLSKENLLLVLTTTPVVLVLGIDAAYQIATGSKNSVFEGLSNVFVGVGGYIGETQSPTIDIFLATLGISFILAIIGLAVYAIRRGNSLIIIWSLAMVVASVAQRRWGYYSAVNVALLAAYCVYIVTQYVNRSAKSMVSGILIIFIIATVLTNTIVMVKLPNDIGNDWYNSMVWLRANSPEPFTTGEQAYYDGSLKERPSYGVLSWWDYGHYIIRIARRVPIDSPTHANAVSAIFLMALTEEESEQVLKDYKYNIQYVVLDADVLEGKFYALVERGGADTSKVGELRPKSQAYRIWMGESLTWKLVYEAGRVRIYERTKAIS